MIGAGNPVEASAVQDKYVNRLGNLRSAAITLTWLHHPSRKNSNSLKTALFLDIRSILAIAMDWH